MRSRKPSFATTLGRREANMAIHFSEATVAGHEAADDVPTQRRRIDQRLVQIVTHPRAASRVELAMEVFDRASEQRLIGGRIVQRGDRAGLKQVDTAHIVDRPFDVLRVIEMASGFASQFPQRANRSEIQTRAPPQIVGRLFVFSRAGKQSHGLVSHRVIQHFARLGRDADNVRLHFAGDDAFAQSPRGLDQASHSASLCVDWW